MVNELILHFKVLTPLYLGDAFQQAELRPPGFKGPLRMWYRAVDPKFSSKMDDRNITREESFFGGSNDFAGQSPFFMHIVQEPDKIKLWKWDRTEVNRYNNGRGPDTVNGLAYLGYPFNLKQKSKPDLRTAIAPGSTFTVRCAVPEKNNHQELRRVLTAAWWFMGNLGGIGSRSRRGFGSLALLKWETTPEPWPELDEFPLVSNSHSIMEWQEGINAALTTIGNWFGSFKEDRHPHIGKGCRIKISPESFPLDNWGKAMAHMGEKMQRFRKAYVSDKKPIKNHLEALVHKKGAYLEHAPDRSTFGLPLTFRFKGIKGDLEFDSFDPDNNKTLERHGSLLHLRLVSISNRLYPLFVRLSGDVPGMAPPAAVKSSTRPLRRPLNNAMDLFLNTLDQ